jgi:hypothetical protein
MDRIRILCAEIVARLKVQVKMETEVKEWTIDSVCTMVMGEGRDGMHYTEVVRRAMAMGYYSKRNPALTFERICNSFQRNFKLKKNLYRNVGYGKYVRM